MAGRLSAKDTNPSYWTDYTNLQRVKHSIIRRYLNGWFPMLGSWSGRIVYLDTHAGRGRHDTGDMGSPIVAIKTLLEHNYSSEIFKRCEVVFSFIETDEKNCKLLESEIDASGKLPKGVKIDVICADCFDAIRGIIEDLDASSRRMAPAFVFVDPYGFKVPIDVLVELMKFERVELFVNVIWRELGMAIKQRKITTGMRETLNMIFGGDEWEELGEMEFTEMADAAITIIKDKIGAKWATYIRMLGETGATRYILLHLSNHDKGRDLMKDCIWSVCPEGGYFARFRDNPDQPELITDDPDLRPLQKWLIGRLSRGPQRWQDLLSELRAESWLEKHLNKVIRDYRKSGMLEGRDFDRFVPSHNPELFLKRRPRL